MPVAVVAAGVMGGASLVAGGLTVMGTIAAVGSVISAVGAVTGDEDLMKIGGIASLVGGVGSVASGQGIFSGAGATSEAAATGATDAGAGVVDSTASTVAPGSEVAPMTVDVGGMTTAPSASPSGLINNTVDPTNALVEMPEAPKAINADGSKLAGVGSDKAVSAAGTKAITTQADSVASTGDTITEMLKKFGSVFKNADGTYDKTALAIGGQMIGGMFDKQKKAAADLTRQQAAILAARQANANAIPNLSALGVTSAPVYNTTAPTFVAPRVGLINA